MILMAKKPYKRKLFKGSKLNIKLINNIRISHDKSKFSISELVTIVIITSFISLLMGLIIANSTTSQVKYQALSDEVQDFLSEYNNLKSNYYGSIDEKDVLKKAFETIVSELEDPYTEIVDDSLSNSLSTRLEGSYEGLGIQVGINNSNNIQIISVIDNTPAQKAGLQYLDIIIGFNGTSVIGLTTTEFAEMVKKNEDDNISLNILRDGNEMTISVKREKIILNSVYSEVKEINNKKIGYIYISVFAANTDKQFIEELQKLKTEKINSLIIDLRDNTGGHLSSVQEIMNYMMDSKCVIYQIEDKKGVKKYYSTGKNNFDKDIVILINQNSASASEMLSASLKENLNAILVGKTSYGKGTVQELQKSVSGVEYKLTTSKWLTPKGNWINKIGIEPDYSIDLSDEFYSNPTDENDDQLQKAIEILSK